MFVLTLIHTLTLIPTLITLLSVTFTIPTFTHILTSNYNSYLFSILSYKYSNQLFAAQQAKEMIDIQNTGTRKHILLLFPPLFFLEFCAVLHSSSCAFILPYSFAIPFTLSLPFSAFPHPCHTTLSPSFFTPLFSSSSPSPLPCYTPSPPSRFSHPYTY